MKKLISTLCVFCLLSIQNSTLASILVPANTSIFITPVETVTSKHRDINNIQATIQNDVIVDGKVVFKAGDKAVLNIGEIEKARCWGNPGKLSVVNGFAYDTKGQKHKILISKNYYGEEKTWPKVMGGISIFFLFPLALFGFVHGGQATVSSTVEIETNLTSQFNF